VGPDDDRREPPIKTDDALRSEPAVHAEVVVTNPPFGKKSSITVVNEEGDSERQTLTYNRPDFWTTTSNKQLNFVQHVKSLLKIDGRAAVVVPDNVLVFDRRPAREKPWTETLWVYDLRTNKHFTQLVARDKVSLDLFWLRDESLEDSASLPDPDVLAGEIVDDLRTALEQVEDIWGDLQQRSKATRG
jgi:type I restriction enzyme M protein